MSERARALSVVGTVIGIKTERLFQRFASKVATPAASSLAYTPRPIRPSDPLCRQSRHVFGF